MVTRKQTDQSKDSITVRPIFHEREFVFDPKLVFTIMPFGDPWSDRVWEALQRIVVGEGMRAERADNRHGPVVTEDIWCGIFEARIVLADVTGWNPNVFYELGIAHTLGKDIVLITQPSARLPFDTQGFRHIIYSDNPAGIRVLEDEIPQKIQHYLKRGESSSRVTPQTEHFPKKKDMELAWVAVSKNWEPALPAMESVDARSQAGALRKRMRQFVYYLSESDSKLFVAEMKKVWPDDFDTIKDKQVAMQFITKIADKLNVWRVKYAERINK